jgi:hypothetical protein
MTTKSTLSLSFSAVLLIGAMIPLNSRLVQSAPKVSGQEPQTVTVAKDSDVLETYRNLCSLSIAERRASFNRASAKERSDLWKVHLAVFLARHTALSNQQQEVLLAGISLATPELFQVQKNDPAWKSKVDEPLKSLAGRAVQLFSKEEAAEIFAQIPTQVLQGDDELLQTYSALKALSMAERKMMFRNAPPKGRSDLWKLHLALSLLKYPGLTPAQQQIILEGISLASAELFESGIKEGLQTKTEIQLQAFTNRVKQFFPKAEGAQIFGQLGEPVNSQSGLKASLPKNSVMKTAHALPKPDCDCSHSSDWCSTVCGGNICNHSEEGCGTLWLYACTGICYVYID